MATHALHIGINQYGSGMSLAGCVNDARDLAAVFGFAQSSTLLLDRKATRPAIISAVAKLCGLLDEDDWGVITFSGHGTNIPDASGDEPDGRDEALVCADLDLIVDDEFALMLGARDLGSRLFIVTDSCHSGSVQRLFAPAPPRSDARARFFPADELPRRAAKRTKPAPARADAFERVVHFAACRDAEYSYDATFNRRPNGAMTKNLIDALKGLKRPTFGQWFKALAARLPTDRYPQHPVCNASRESLALKVPRS
jgi:metacaspase-1